MNNSYYANRKCPPGSRIDVVLGAQWGDEGKGKVVDMLATTADVVCRCQVRKRTCRNEGSCVALDEYPIILLFGLFEIELNLENTQNS